MEETLEAIVEKRMTGFVGVVKCWYGEILLWTEDAGDVRDTEYEAQRDANMYRDGCVNFAVYASQ